MHRDYAGTPLPKKLGIRPDSRVLVVGAPEGFIDGLRAPGAELVSRIARDLDVVVLFATKQAEIRRRFPKIATSITPDGRIWVCWPKKSSRVMTDADFESVQRTGLDAGLVDNKSASITDVFQGLQFVRRLKDRPRPAGRPRA